MSFPVENAELRLIEIIDDAFTVLDYRTRDRVLMWARAKSEAIERKRIDEMEPRQ